MSNASGSRLFAGDKKSIIRILTISLYVFATISAALFAYQLYTEPASLDLISRDEAIQTALKAGQWDKWDRQKATGNMEIHATLVHVQPNGMGLQVDGKSYQDIPRPAGQFRGYENQYLWVIDIFGPDIYGNKNTIGWIHADTGKILSIYPLES